MDLCKKTIWFYIKIYFSIVSVNQSLIIRTINLNPKISIITSVYNSDKFIEHFLNNITQQTIFNQCELILINANSPGIIEEDIILKYQQVYPNIIYQRLAKDPGLYAVWNLAIKQARGQYITNANVDDRLFYNCYEQHAQLLDNNPEISLVYSNCYITDQPNVNIETMPRGKYFEKPEFSIAAIKNSCLPSFNPMWRKSVHDLCGPFDEKFIIIGDYEMWIRMANMSLKFNKCPEVLGIYYRNHHGLSTASGKHSDRLKIEQGIMYAQYKEFFA